MNISSLHLCLAFHLLLSLIGCSTQQPEESLSLEIERLIEKSGAEVAVALRTLDGREELFLGADEVFHAASTMKIPVMIELFRQARESKLDLNEKIVIVNEFASIVDGSGYALSIDDDSDSDIYGALGSQRSLLRLCEDMITISSNLATNLLIERLGAKNIQATVDRLNAGGMKVLRGVEDGKAYREGLNNTTTARALLVLLEKIARLEAVDEAADRQMIEILKRQKFNEAIPAGLPEGIPVAHKTGQITRIHHDAGIVLAARPYVLVLLVRGLEDEADSSRLMSAISNAVYRSLS